MFFLSFFLGGRIIPLYLPTLLHRTSFLLGTITLIRYCLFVLLFLLTSTRPKGNRVSSYACWFLIAIWTVLEKSLHRVFFIYSHQPYSEFSLDLIWVWTNVDLIQLSLFFYLVTGLLLSEGHFTCFHVPLLDLTDADGDFDVFFP